jgi:hypothetical protein
MSFMAKVVKKQLPHPMVRALLLPLLAAVIAGCGSGAHGAARSAATGTSGATGTTGSKVPAGTSSASAPGAATPGRCAPQQLGLAYLGSQGATGHIEASFQLRNASQKQCTLFGYPGAQMLGANGNLLPTHVQRGGSFFTETRRAPHTVSLAPGEAARFVFGYSDNPEYGGGKACPQAVKLEVTPPNTYSRLAVSMPAGANSFAPCGGVLVASPVY